MSQKSVSKSLAALLLCIMALVGALFFDAAPVFAAEEGFDEETSGEALDGVAGFVASGAINALDWALRFLDIGASPRVVEEDSNGWFSTQYRMMVAISVWVMAPLLFIAIIHAVAKGSMQLLIRSVLVFLPVSFLGMAAAVQVVQLLLDMTDDFSAAFSASIQGDAEAFFGQITCFFSADCSSSEATGTDGVSLILVILFALALMFVCACVYIVLVLREASVYISTSFLPLGFAMLVWPSTARFFRKMLEFLIAMIFSKVVMVAGVSLAMASMAGVTGVGSGAGASLQVGQGADPGAPTALQEAAAVDAGWMGGVGMVVESIAMFALIAFAPSMVMRIVGTLGLSEAAAAVGRSLDRPSAMNQLIFTNRMLGMRNNARQIADIRNNQIPAAQQWAQETSLGEYRLAHQGVVRNPDTGNYEISAAQLQEHNVDRQHWDEIMRLSRSQNPDDIALAHYALHSRSNFIGFEQGGEFGTTTIVQRNANGDEDHLVLQNTMHNGRPITRQDPRQVQLAVERSLANGARNVRVISSLDPRAEADNIRAIRHTINNVAAEQNIGPDRSISFETIGLADQRARGLDPRTQRLAANATSPTW